MSFVLLAAPFAAHAVDLDAKVEGGVALPLSAPQSNRFDAGGAGTIKGLIGVEGGYVDLAAGLTFIGLHAADGYASDSPGTAWAPSLGLRIQRPRESEEMRLMSPHPHESFHGARPWLDADILYVRTGGLDRAGFAGAVGLAFPIGQSRSFWLGPFVRYFQILQQNKSGVDDRDAKLLIIGLSFEAGTRLVRPTRPEPATICPAVVAVADVPPAPISKPDRDGDGVPDDVDACPDVQGPPANAGCPVYERLIVKPDRLELKEKIQFAQNTAVIDPVSHPLLDEVARALVENKNLRVAIEGNASSEGSAGHNQVLSEERANAVLDYIAHHGVARDRLVAKGFSSSRPIESNATESGREANRRVEFVVQFTILKEETK